MLSHWQNVDGDPLEDGVKANEILRSLRKRNGCLEGLPQLDIFWDKL